MKKGLKLLLMTLLCGCLCACGGNADTNDTNANKQQENNVSGQNQTENQTSTPVNENSTSTKELSLPMNVGETYQCVLDGVEGYVQVTEYEIVPDEMNEGSSVRNVFIDAVFYNAPADFDVSAVIFTVNGSVEALNEGMWMQTDELGNQLMIFDYGNQQLYSTYENKVYAESLLISYMVPDSYDELALTLVAGNQRTSLESVSKEEVLTEESCWFMLGSLNQGGLNYKGEAIKTLAATANEQDMYAYRTTVATDKDKNMNQEQMNEYPVFEKSLRLVELNKLMREEHDGMVLEFESIHMIDYSEETCTFEITVHYSGLQSGDTLICYLFDGYNEVHVDSAERTTDTEGSFTFEFTGRTENAPFTFSAGVRRNGEELFISGIHVDAEIE